MDAWPLESVLTTRELEQRPSRPADYQREAAALRRLSAALGSQPENILNLLVDEIRQLTGSGSAGLSLAEVDQGEEIFRWRALSGDLSPFLNGTMPRYFSPCGVVLDRKAVQLMSEPVRHFPYIEQLGMPICEVLLVPFISADLNAGTLWVCAHDPHQHFDQEDSRIVHSLAEFAAAAISVYFKTLAMIQQKEELRQNRKKLADILTSLPMGISIMEGPEHRYTFTNQMHADFHAGCGEFKGKTAREVRPELAHTPVFDLLDQVYATGVTYSADEMPIELAQADGQLKLFYISFSYQAIRDASDQICGIVSTFIDVTEKIVARNLAKENSDLVAKTERLLSDAVNVAKVGFYDWDIVADKFSLSPQFQLDWGLETDVPFAKAFERIVPEDRERVQALVDKAVAERSIYSAEYRIVRPTDGKLVWIHAKGSVSTDENGQPLRFFGTSIDISAQKAIEAEINEARIAADRANDAKSSFLANMSHELRSPLGAITGFAELLKNKDLCRSDIENFVSVIDRNSQHLLALLDDILDLAKVEAGKMIIERIAFSLVDLLYDFAAQMQLRALEKGIAFEMKIQGSIPNAIESDPTRLRQILNNVVGNAIKFTDYGRVQLLVSCHGRQLEFLVKDTGIGMTPQHAAQLFQPFHQADASTTRNYGGTGLGLVLTRKLTEAMQGHFILVNSVPGVGSTFAASIEVALATDATCIRPLSSAQAEIRPRVLEGMKVLVVEDSKDNQLLFSRILASVGAQVDKADDGYEGVSLAMANDYSVVLMDVQMPRMDGHEAAQILRNKNYRVPIIALTAHAMKEEREKAQRSGFSDYLSKPFRVDDLIKKLARLHLS